MNIGRAFNPATGEMLPLVAVSGSAIMSPREAREAAESLMVMADQCDGRRTTTAAMVELVEQAVAYAPHHRAADSIFSALRNDPEATEAATRLLNAASVFEQSPSGYRVGVASYSDDPPASLRERRDRGLPCAVTVVKSEGRGCR